MIGDPITYQLKTDDTVTFVLMGCVFLITMALMMMGKPWGRKIGQLPFFNFRQNDLMVTETPGGIQPFLIAQMALAVGILLFSISLRMIPEVVELPLPSVMMLAAYVALATVFLAIRWLSYKFVLWMFVPSGQIPLIMESWINSVCFEGVLLLPFLLIVIYYNIPFTLFVILLFIITFFPRFWLFYWLKKLFCPNLYGSMLIFLYFCALEMVPLVLVVIGTQKLNRYLLFYY